MSVPEDSGDLSRSFGGKGVYPHELSFLLDLPLRRLILSPGTLAGRLHLLEDSRILEIGPGSGYFTIEVARRIPRGRLELLDIQPEMLEKIRRKANKAGLTNLGFTIGDAARLPYDAESFDTVYMVTVLGEVQDRDACLADINRVLKPGGILSVTEQPGDSDHIPLSRLRPMVEEHGFSFFEDYSRKLSYTANFRK